MFGTGRPCVALLVTLLAPLPALAQDPWPVAVLFWSEVSCPDRPTLVAALERRGNTVVPTEQAALQLEVGLRGTDVAVTLRDRGGQVLAERALPAGECDALADAIALLVERRVQGVDWEGAVPGGPAPPPQVRSAPSAPPRHVARQPSRAPWQLHAQGGVFFGTELEDRGGRPGPAFALRLLPPGLVDVALSFAWLSYAGLPIEDVGSLDLDRYPVALSSSLAVRRPRWEARAGAMFEVDVLAYRTHLPRSASPVRAALRLGPAVALACSPLAGVWIELAAALPIKLHGYELVVDGIGTIERQSRFAIEVGASLGYRFRT